MPRGRGSGRACEDIIVNQAKFRRKDYLRHLSENTRNFSSISIASGDQGHDGILVQCDA